MNPLAEWTRLVCDELAVTDAVDMDEVTRQILVLTREVAHSVDRPAGPVTMYLIGLAAGRSADPAATTAASLATVREMVERWTPAE
ncbi:MAG: molybdopterin-guanine dinucleotide biosynthesis protein [Actinobacteria bacterium]|nr:molybdopterin-guanine dinucleotide biosynthesis protein [Actinomycetota bacterium]MBI3687880.1 molybdopterin-guanine dinucleotide biosynthesis protein [Actinomycetota bacterium]